MEKLKSELEELLRRLPDQTAFRQRLDNLVSVYPFNEYEYIISTLLAMDVLSLDAYHDLRNDYIARERYLPIFQISSPTGFGKTWASKHLRELVPELRGQDLIKGGAGVRAQVVRPDGTLMDDFHIEEAPRAIHVLNTPSPAATASLAIGEYIVMTATASFDLADA